MLLANKIPIRFIYRSIRADVLRVMAFSVSFHVIKIFVIDPIAIVPTALPTILGTAISLLLGFNVNQSYERWWEARKIWGSIVNDSRSLVLQLQAFVGVGREKSELARGMIARMAYRQIAWCYALACSLRGEPALAHVNFSLLPDEERASLESHVNIPLALAQRHAADIRKLHEARLVNDYQQMQLDRTLVRLVESMGMAERIKKTVFPVTYRIFVHYFVYLFLIVLSLTLVETIGVLEIPILVVIAASFFMIETTARQLQDPFENRPHDTAMTSISRSIEIDLRQLLGESHVPEPYPPERFYIL
jgi:ion channel-forming bestrophin family protein